MTSFEHTRTIFVASDSTATIEQLQTILEQDLHAMLVCQDSAALLEMAMQGTADLILIDDVLDGFALCEQVHSLPDAQHVPIIMMLSQDDDPLIEQAFTAGATDYVLKPLRVPIVRQRVQYLLQIREMQANLIENEERYRIISSMISDYAYVFRVNPDGSFTKEWSNQAFEAISGYDFDESDLWSKLIHPDDAEIARQRYRNLLAGERDISTLRIITKSGEVRWVMDHGYPVFDKRLGRIVRVYGAAQDITERKQNEEMLLEQAAELQERNQELDSFAHSVAHDLKNPISSMMGFASLILNYFDRMTDKSIKENLELIMESGYKLKEIINSLLLLASVNKLDEITLSRLDMRAIIRESMARMQPLIEEYHAKIIVPETFPIALGYAPWVEEVWANYLNNALKYGGRPPLVEFGADEPRKGMVRFWIIDNGGGLTPEEQEKVFTPFTRLSQAKIEGHGLGLSVVHRIVEKLGGEVGVESVQTGGSKFTFTLPADPSCN